VTFVTGGSVGLFFVERDRLDLSTILLRQRSTYLDRSEKGGFLRQASGFQNGDLGVGFLRGGGSAALNRKIRQSHKSRVQNGSKATGTVRSPTDGPSRSCRLSWACGYPGAAKYC
jgi:hypothetical protein